MATQAQINQVASQVAQQPVSSPVASTGTPDTTNAKANIAKALEPYMGKNIPDEVLAAVQKAAKS